MVKKLTTRPAAKSASGIEARDLWLASLGAVSLTRKQGIKLYGTLLDEGKQFQGRIEDVIGDLQGQAKAGVSRVKAQVGAIVAPLRERAESTFTTVKTEVESRLSPVFDKLGVKLTQLTKPQAEYIGVPQQGPFKSDLYRS